VWTVPLHRRSVSLHWRYERGVGCTVTHGSRTDTLLRWRTFFEQRLPILANPKLVGMTESFFAQSGGLVGVLST
jgi:hypothetical protein